MKDVAEIKPQYPDDKVSEPIPGHDIANAPQPALTAPTGGNLSTGGGNLYTPDSVILSNAITRLNQMEAALIKLGLLRHH